MLYTDWILILNLWWKRTIVGKSTQDYDKLSVVRAKIEISPLHQLLFFMNSIQSLRPSVPFSKPTNSLKNPAMCSFDSKDFKERRKRKHVNFNFVSGLNKVVEQMDWISKESLHYEMVNNIKKKENLYNRKISSADKMTQGTYPKILWKIYTKRKIDYPLSRKVNIVHSISTQHNRQLKGKFPINFIIRLSWASSNKSRVNLSISFNKITELRKH